MAKTIAKAAVEIFPEMVGIQSKITKGLAGLGSSTGSAFGKRFDSSGAKGMGKLAAIAGVVGSVFSGLANTIGSAISQNLDAAISRADTFIAFPKVMQNLGYSADESNASIKAMSEHLKGLPTSLDSMVSVVQRLAPLTGSLENATDLTLALNDAMLASGASTQDVERAVRQYSQALAKGKPTQQDWNTLVETMPVALDQVAKSMLGSEATAQSLKDALDDGTITMEDFSNALIELDKNGSDAFSSMYDQAKAATGGIRTAFTNVGNAITRNLADVLMVFSDNFMGGADAISAVIDKIGASLTTFAEAFKNSIDWEGWKQEIDLIGQAFMYWFPAEGGTAASFGAALAEVFNDLRYILHVVAAAAFLLGGALRLIAEDPALLIIIPSAVFALRLLAQNLGSAGMLTGRFGKAMGDAGKMGKQGAKGVKVFGRAAGNMVAFGATFLMVGFGLKLIADGIANVAQYGDAGVAAMLSLIGVFGVIAGVLVGVGLAAEIAIPGLLAFAAAFIGVAFGIKLVTDATAGLVTAIGEAAPGISQIVTSIAQGIATVIVALSTGISRVIMTLANGISMVITTLGESLQGIIDSLANAFLAFGQATISTGQGLLLIVTALGMLVGMNLLDLGVSLGTAAQGVGDLVSAGEGAAGAAMGLMLMASGMVMAASQASVLQTSMLSLQMGVITAGTAFGLFASAVTNQLAMAAAKIAAFVAYATTAINGMRLVIPRIEVAALPHFRLNGKFDPETGAVPTVSVQWYAKGAIFNRASLIGVGEGRYPEAVLPLSPSVLAGIGEGIQGGGTTNVYFNNNRVNSRPDIEAAFYSFMAELQRLGVMEGGA